MDNEETMQHHNRDLETERQELTVRLQQLVPLALREQIAAALKTVPPPAQFNVIVSHSGAANADEE